MEPQEQEYPHCSASLPTPRYSPLVIPATVSYVPPVPPATTGSWIVKKNPIQLQNDHDEVVWDLKELFGTLSSKAAVQIHFTAGPPVLDTNLGPHLSLNVDKSNQNADGKQRNHSWGCYTYVFMIDETGSGQFHPLSFLVDPQIDNLPPPDKPLRKPHHHPRKRTARRS